MKWGDNIRGKIDQLRSGRALFLATTGTMVDMSRRIWGQGGLSEGGALQYKENYELYAYRPPAPRAVSGKGKPNKDGKSRKIKGGYYPTYLAFKAQQGRAQTPFDLTGSLRLDWLGGVSPFPVEQGPLTCQVALSEVNAAKAAGLAKQKGQFLLLTQGEKSGHRDRLSDIWSDILSK